MFTPLSLVRERVARVAQCDTEDPEFKLAFYAICDSYLKATTRHTERFIRGLKGPQNLETHRVLDWKSLRSDRDWPGGP